MNYLIEDSRKQLMDKSKKSKKGNQRFKRRTKSKIATSVRQYNSIDTNKLFKEDILTVDISVKGETSDYTVRISFSGLLKEIRNEMENKKSDLSIPIIRKSISKCLNKDDVYIHCSCPDFHYRFGYYATKNDINSGEPETRPSDITNPLDTLGSACKHTLLVLSNTMWIDKVASVINNYVKYMSKFYKKAYADIIYPAIYDKKFDDDVQMGIFDKDELDSDSDTISAANQYGRKSGQFKKGNDLGYKFTSNKITDDDQLQIDLGDN